MKANGVKVTIKKNNTQAIIAATSGGKLGKAVQAGGFILETAIKISMAAASHAGILYKRSGKKKAHQASAAGETPAVATGVYINSIITQLVSETPTRAMAEVGTNSVYANRLELGFMETDSLGRKYQQAPRPHFRPAYDKNKQGMLNSIHYWAKQNLEQAAKP